MNPLLVILGAGITWLLVFVAAVVVLCRAAALGDSQAELAQIIDLDDYRCTWDWPSDAA